VHVGAADSKKGFFMPSEVVIVSESRELSLQEQRTLEACEADIAKGIELQAKALQTIRDQRLYRREFATFDEYVTDRIGKSKRWADYQIKYIEVIGNLAEQMGTMVPKISERATREISELEPQQQAEVVRSVVDSGEKPTAKNVKQERQKIAPKPEPTPQQQVKDFFDDKPKQASEPEPEPEQPTQRDRNEEFRLQRSKTIKTCESLLRAIDDLHTLLPRRQNQGVCIDQTKRILEVVRNWK